MIEVTLYENDANIGTIEITDSDSFPLALTKSNSDIRDITKRQGVYTKDFKVLATSKNNKLLKYIYNANASAIGGRDCSISYNGMPILTGLIFAIQVGQRNQSDEYTLRIYSDNVDWYTLLGGATINSYDYGNSEVASFGMTNGQLSGTIPASTTQSTLSRAYIEASWRFPDLFDYVYPLISYGQPDNGTYVAETDMRPAIYIGKMLTKAFTSIGYTLDSDFFSTGIGSRLILPFIGDNFINSIVAANSFDVTRNTSQTLFSGVWANPSPTGIYTLIFNTTITDPSAIYNTTTGQLNVLVDGDYTFDLNGVIRVTGVTSTSFVGNVRLQLRDLSSNILFDLDITPPLNGATPSIDIQVAETTTPVLLTAGSYEFVLLFEFLNLNNDNITVSMQAGFSAEQSLDITIAANQTYNVGNTLTDLKVLDVLGGLQNIFNLYFDTNNDTRTVTIEPKPALLKPLSEGIDFTSKLDVKNRITTDIVQVYNRSLQFRYGNDSNDKWQNNYNQQQGTIFGSALYDLGSNFKDGVTELGTKAFAATLLYDNHPFSPSGCPIPVMWSENAQSPPKSYDFLPRILYYKGYVEIFQAGGIKASWRWLNVTLTTLPSCFMLDPTTSSPIDVNLLYNDSDTANGLVREYYNSDISVIHDRRVHKAFFRITGIDFRNIDLFKPIYLDHVNLQGWYYINQVIDFTPNKEKTTLYELVKAFDTLPFDRPIATEIPTIQGSTRQLSAIGGGTLTGSGKQSFESLVGFNGSGNVGIIRGGGTVLGNGNIQTVTDQHIFGNYNFGNDSTWVVGIGSGVDGRYNGLQLTTAGVFKVHGGTVRTIVNSTIQDVYATIEGSLETVHLLGNGG
jgi:hypothetical protein